MQGWKQLGRAGAAEPVGIKGMVPASTPGKLLQLSSSSLILGVFLIRK